MYNNCAELGGGAHNPTVIGSVAIRKGPRRFCPHLSDCCHALMLMCWNSPLWQCCGHCNNVLSSFLPSWVDQSNSVVIMWIGISLKLAAYNYMSSLALWTTVKYELVDANGGIQKARLEPATRSAVTTWIMANIFIIMLAWTCQESKRVQNTFSLTEKKMDRRGLQDKRTRPDVKTWI